MNMQRMIENMDEMLLTMQNIMFEIDQNMMTENHRKIMKNQKSKTK